MPEAAVHYVFHIELGRSIREIARETGYHASTVLRRVRRCENRRDDPLVDGAFDRLSVIGATRAPNCKTTKESRTMTATIQAQFTGNQNTDLSDAAFRVLRRLAETGAVLAVAQEMEKAVVVRELPGGKSAQTTIVAREVAEVMALNEWIVAQTSGRISRYTITGLGRAALKRMLAGQEESDAPDGMNETAQPFAAQHREWDNRRSRDGDGARKAKYNLAESPLSALARRRDKSGKFFLSDDLVAAGERLREDFELSQMGPRVAQNWDNFMTGPRSGGQGGREGRSNSAQSARDRVHAALADLGPGLGDVVLRCCCFLEGIETTEKTMGWSARSGKIVLRIALQRLRRHYDETGGKHMSMIG
jgi:DNA-directed RNA polymerase specialized sigma24 family protein